MGEWSRKNTIRGGKEEDKNEKSRGEKEREEQINKSRKMRRMEEGRVGKKKEVGYETHHLL